MPKGEGSLGIKFEGPILTSDKSVEQGMLDGYNPPLSRISRTNPIPSARRVELN